MEKRERKGKRPNGEGNYRQRANETWECRITLPNGKRKSIYAPTFEEIKAARKQAERDIEKGRDMSAPRQTVAQFLDQWLSDVVKSKVRPSTFESYTGHVRNHLIPSLGKHQLAALTPQHVQALMNAKLKEGRSPRTVTYMRGVLRQALGEALKWGLVSRNVAALVSPPRSQQKPVQPLSPDQVRVLIEATKDDRLGALFHVAIATGMCQGELLGLRWEDVNLDLGTLRIGHALQVVNGAPELVSPKTDRSRRTLSLPASAL